jgi:hypothetical protein
MKIAAHYSDEKPSYYFLKERLRQISREKLLQIIKQKTIVSGLDSFFLKDATEFLRLSILNLLAYKFLMSGSFLAWGEVTLYYSNFYSINCLLRLKGFALVHLEYLDEKTLTVRVVRTNKENRYSVLKWKGGNTHQYLWNKFSELYPQLFSPLLGKLMIKDRERWNYDLSFPSQSMTDYAKEDAKIRWQNNFLDPSFGSYADPDAAEYYYDLMADTGYEEAGSGDLIKKCISLLTEIASNSKHKAWYVSYFAELTRGIEDFGSHPDTKREIQGWLTTSIAELQKL